MDKIIFCGKTAFKYWHSLRTEGSPRLGALQVVPRQSERLGLQPSYIRKAPAQAPADDYIRSTAIGLLSDQDQIHLLVSSSAGRRNSLAKHCHVWSTPLPIGSLACIAPNVYVVTPEFLLLQMAPALPLAAFLTLLYELCGSYATAHWGSEAFNRCQPLTATRILKAFVSRTERAKGIKNLRRVLPHLADGSGSAMETAIVLLLCTPVHGGGYGLPLPRLNSRVAISPQASDTGAAHSLYPDLFWPSHKVALEYDGQVFHSGAEAAHRDYRRANELQAQGISLEVLTKRETFDANLFDIAARKLARRLGVKLRRQFFDAQWRMRRKELREEVFGSWGSQQKLMEGNSLLAGFWPSTYNQ